ncbi:MAG TPA: hypothetical protein VFZ16_11445 [Hyphomicrobiaceae bacterium]|nr:hypothetical protein [Hyphomicrobiaceae bacterium]
MRQTTDQEIEANASTQRTARIAEHILGHPVAQRLPWHAIEALLAVARGDADVDPTDAERLVHCALAVCITSEILSAREART